MGIYIGLVISLGLIAFVGYYILLTTLGINRRPKAVPITNPEEYAARHIILEGEIYAKMTSIVLHKSIFFRPDIVKQFANAQIPIYVVFGPHMCWKSYRFIQAFKQNKNIRLFQIREDIYKDFNEEERAWINHYLNRKKRRDITVVDGIHCYVEFPHPEGQEGQGMEYMYDFKRSRECDSEFDHLMRFCSEVDREQVLQCVELKNITLTDPKTGEYRHANKREVKSLARKLGEPISTDQLNQLG